MRQATETKAKSPAAIRANRQESKLFTNRGKSIVPQSQRLDNPPRDHMASVMAWAERLIARGYTWQGYRIWFSAYAMRHDLPWPPTGRDVYMKGGPK